LFFGSQIGLSGFAPDPESNFSKCPCTAPFRIVLKNYYSILVFGNQESEPNKKQGTAFHDRSNALQEYDMKKENAQQ
jgi:hypothetical protein